jgi:hypothetical protein
MKRLQMHTIRQPIKPISLRFCKFIFKHFSYRYIIGKLLLIECKTLLSTLTIVIIQFNYVCILLQEIRLNLDHVLK